MTKYELIMGLNDQDTKKQEIPTIDALKKVKSYIAGKFGGATVSMAQGIYQHENGDVVTEMSVKVELLFAEEKQIREAVEFLKKEFNQESVVVQKYEVSSELW